MTGERSIRYLVIAPDGSIEPHEGVLDTGAASDIVDGDIEVLPDPRDADVVLIANTEGKRMGLDANWQATRLIRHALRTTDFVAGNVIVAGTPDSAGNLTDVTDERERQVRDVLAQ